MPAVLLATQTPLPQSGTSDYDFTLGPLGAQSLISGIAQTISAPFNENAGRLDVLGRWGGGVYAILTGLAVTEVSGLTVRVGTGLALIDTLVRVTATQDLLLTDATRNHLWISRTGVATFRTDLLAPGTDYLYLGSVLTAAGAYSSDDTSGVMYLRGGLPWRQTADNTVPSDTPSGMISFIHQGQGKLWLWSPILTDYFEIAAGSGTYNVSRYALAPANGTNTLSAENSANTYIDVSAGTASSPWVLELTTTDIPNGLFWIIDNGSSYGARVAKAGSGVAYNVIGPDQIAIFGFDSNEIHKVATTGPRYTSAAISGTYSPAQAQVEADHISISSVGVNTFNLPVVAGMEGGVRWIHASENQSALVVQAAGEGSAERITRLMAGEIQPFVQDGANGQRLGVTRPYTRLVTHEMTTDADYTLTAIEATHWIVEITDTVVTLTGGKNIILPLVGDHSWIVANLTAQILTFKGSSGTGVAVGAGKYAFLYTEGTNVYGPVFP